MDKVKAALSDFTHRSGHNDTTVHEAVAPAVQHEVIKPHVHEEIVTAVDKEVHQDHYHRTVQPIQDREVLPETHTAKLGEVQHREFDERNHDHIKRNLIAEQAQFKDERRVDDTTYSKSVAPVVGGEHVHHHIHETIQPVVQKETIQPNVVHTTVPIHEVHHKAATHHEVTALPALTMEQFKAKGGVLSGREERYDEFEGVPKNIGGSTTGLGALKHDGQHTGLHGTEHARHGDYTGQSGTGLTGTHGTTGGLGSSGTHGTTGHNTTGHSSTSGKPSLMDKLNPKVDANGDGKAGFMK